MGKYRWPHHRPTGAPYVETAWVAYDQINSLTLGYINIPNRKEVKCYLSPIKALPHVSTRLLNPSVTMGGRRLTFPIGLESGQYLDFRSLTDCKVYGRQGEVVRTVRPQGEVPMLRAGENQVAFDCGVDSPVNVRANVTLISQDHRTFGK